MRAAAPGMGILIYSGVERHILPEDATPDAFVRKGEPLLTLVTTLREILQNAPFDVVRLELGVLPLKDAIIAFDTWTGLNARVLYALNRGDELAGDQLGGATREQLEALMGVYAHIGHELQSAAHAGRKDVTPVLHVFRSVAVLARGALLAFNNHRLAGFWKIWGYEVPDEAVAALSLMRDRLMDVLAPSSGRD